MRVINKSSIDETIGLLLYVLKKRFNKNIYSYIMLYYIIK